MPTTLPGGGRRRAQCVGFALKAAMLTSVLLLAALVQVTVQIHFAAPAYTLGQIAMMPPAAR